MLYAYIKKKYNRILTCTEGVVHIPTTVTDNDDDDDYDDDGDDYVALFYCNTQLSNAIRSAVTFAYTI